MASSLPDEAWSCSDFTLASLVLWSVLLIVVALIPLGVGLPLTAATLRAIRDLEARAWRHIADWCGFAAAAPRPAGPAGREGGMPSFWVRFGSLMADPDTWRSLVWTPLTSWRAGCSRSPRRA